MRSSGDVKKTPGIIRMAGGYDGRALAAVLANFLPSGSSLLEIGMGRGRDLELLAERYKVTGSDVAPAFLDLYREKRPMADLLCLDAETLETRRKFDCIFSNKVLHYLGPDQVARSLRKQREALNSGGIAFHTVWFGDKAIEADGTRFHYYTERAFHELASPWFSMLHSERYREIDFDDSLLLILKRK